MTLVVHRDHAFAGIFVRLQRANENISNLQGEIRRFFQECKYPIMPKPDDERWQEAMDYHRELYIPKRFGVLAGEVVHQWRSCLDNIVWMFSSPMHREKFEIKIQFPILDFEPTKARDLERLEGQIGGITNPSLIRDLIIKFQPYKLGSEAVNSPFKIIHDMDRFDKHRELTIVHSTGNLFLPPTTPPDIVEAAAAYAENQSGTLPQRRAVYQAIQQYGEVTPQVAFAKFGNRKGQFVVPSLQKLAGSMEHLVTLFIDAAGDGEHTRLSGGS